MPGAQRARRRRGGPRRRRTVRDRRSVPHRGQPPQPDRAADDHGGLGRRPPDAVRLDDGHPRRPSSPSPHLLGLPLARRPRAHALRRRQLRHARRWSGRTSRSPRWPPARSAGLSGSRSPAPQMFTSHGHREEQEQRITLGATRDGRLTAIRHEKLSITSPFDDWAEPATGVSSQLYACAELRGRRTGSMRGNTMTPTFTRGPGESVGVVRARDGDGRAGARARPRPARAAAPQPRRRATRAATRGRATASRSACARGAERFGWARPRPGAARTP